MNKKYMDFVPVGKAEKGAKKDSSSSVSVKKQKKEDELRKIKSQKIGGVSVKKTGLRGVSPSMIVEKPVEKSKKKEGFFEIEERKTLTIPKANFINKEKVVKRPLSKNVYQKKIEATKEEPKGPVTIITKPEKDSKAGIIIAIILTIILGATAGTIAFLLLPK